MSIRVLLGIFLAFSALAAPAVEICSDERSAQKSLLAAYSKVGLSITLTSVQNVTPRAACLDLNGDGLRDAIYFGTLPTSNVTEQQLSAIEFFKPLAMGQNTGNTRSRLTATEAHSYVSRPVLFILLTQGKKRGRPRLVALVDFLNSDASRVLRVRRDDRINAAAYPDSVGTSPPPKLIGEGMSFVGRRGSGTLIYWDGQLFRWYPIDSE